MRSKALLVCAFLLASIFLIVAQPASAALAEEDYDITKYDPMDDVMRARTGGDFKFSPHNNVEITVISSSYKSGLIPQIELKMTVEGQIKKSDDYKYAFTVIADNDEYIFAAYQDGQVVGLNLESSDPIIATASGENTDTLTITFAVSEIGPPNNKFDIFGAAIYSIEDSERFLDMAPDKLLLITAPSHLSTVNEGITISGEVRQYSSGSPSGTIKISIDDGPLEDVSGFDPWSYPLDTTTLTDGGQYTIRVEIEGTGYSDEIRINVDQNTGNYDSFDKEPVVHVGDWYEYTSVGTPKLSGITLPISSEADTRVTDLTTVDGKEVYQVETHSEGGDSIGYITFKNTVDRTSWKEKNGFGTIKENTVTNVEIDFRPDTQVNTTTSYSPPLETHSGFQVTVGSKNFWTLHTTADAESETTVAGGEPTYESYTEPLDIRGECLYYLSSHNVHGNNYPGIYVIKSQYENPGVSVVEYYSRDLGVPVQIDTYDASRELMFSLGLNDYFQVPFSVIIDTITFDPAEPEVDSNTDIKVTVENIGDEIATNVKVTVKDGDREIGEKTISSITVGQSGDETFSWKPKGEGTHNIKVQLSYLNTPLAEKTVSVDVSEAEADGPGDMTFILIVLVIIIVAVILVVVLMKSRGKKEAEAPATEAQAAETEPTVAQAPAAGGVVVASDAPAAAPAQAAQTQMNQETIQCPSCKNGFTIEYESKPVRVKCPTCGMEGVLN